MRADRLAEAIRENVSAWYEGKRTFEAFHRFQAQLWLIAKIHRIDDAVAQMVSPNRA